MEIGHCCTPLINVRKLYISHNLLKNLEGIQNFKNLTHLSVAFNRISDLKELWKIQHRKNLICLNVKENRLTNIPNY